MKLAGLVLGVVVVCGASAWAEDLVNRKEFQAVDEKARDMGFNMSLAQTARLLEFCGQKPKAQEIRDYLQPVTMVRTSEVFKTADATEAEKMNMRGMFLSRMIVAAIATERATQNVLDELGPLSEVQRKTLCDKADKGYSDVMELRARAKAAGAAAVSRTAVVSGTAPAAK